MKDPSQIATLRGFIKSQADGPQDLSLAQSRPRAHLFLTDQFPALFMQTITKASMFYTAIINAVNLGNRVINLQVRLAVCHRNYPLPHDTNGDKALGTTRVMRPRKPVEA
jgi:hypothetical protein